MPIEEMAQKFPEAFAQFQSVCKTLEDHYRDCLLYTSRCV